MSLGFVHKIKADQVIESDALLSTSHALEKSVVCNQQQWASVLLRVKGLSLLSVVVLYKTEALQMHQLRIRIKLSVLH